MVYPQKRPLNRSNFFLIYDSSIDSYYVFRPMDKEIRLPVSLIFKISKLNESDTNTV